MKQVYRFVSVLTLISIIWFTSASFGPARASAPSHEVLGISPAYVLAAESTSAEREPALTSVAQTGWDAWEAVPGAVLATSAPTATTWSRDRLEIFVRGDGGALLWQTFAGGRWSGWRNLGGSLASAHRAPHGGRSV